jgi:hypothetical protein
MLGYKTEDFMNESNFCDLINGDITVELPVIVDIPADLSLSLVEQISCILSSSDASRVDSATMEQLFSLLRDFPLYGRDQFSPLDLFPFLETVISASDSSTIRLALLSLHCLYKLWPDAVRSFVFENHAVLIPLIDDRSLVSEILTLILVSIDFTPFFATTLAVEHKLLSHLLSDSVKSFDPIVTYAILQTISELLLRVSIDAFDSSEIHDIRDLLRSLAVRYLGPTIERQYLIPPILIPTLRILDGMFVKWDIPSVSAILECDVFDKLVGFTNSMTEYDRFKSVYSESLRVWNRLFVRYGEFLDKTAVASGLVQILVDHMQVPGVPRIKILFLLSNILSFPEQGRLFLEKECLLEEMFAHFDDLNVKEKENFVIMVSHLIELHPAKVSEVFHGLSVFFEVAFDFVGAAHAFHCPLHFVRALTTLIRLDPGTKKLIDHDYAFEALWELKFSEIDSVRIATEQLLMEIGFEVG